MTNQSQIHAPATAYCPKCGAETHQEKRSYYCQLAVPGASKDQVLAACVYPARLKRTMEKPDETDIDDPCMDCRHFAVIIEDQGTVVDVDLNSDGSKLHITETHRCRRCGEAYCIRAL
jgi:hypothetical protein